MKQLKRKTEEGGSKLAQAEVFDKVGILAKARLTTKHIHDNFADAAFDLVSRPGRNSCSGKVGLVGHHPTREVSNGSQFFRKFHAKRLRSAQDNTSNQNCSRYENPNSRHSRNMASRKD